MSKTLKVQNGDIVISSSNGRPISIDDSSKLSQDIYEFFNVNVTPTGFGAGIENLIGMVEISENMFVTLVERQITDGLSRFIALQRSNQSIPRSIRELVSRVTGILVQRNPTDPTSYYFRVNFITKDGEQRSITTTVSV